MAQNTNLRSEVPAQSKAQAQPNDVPDQKQVAGGYKYEVAFSCLKEDEPYAHDLYERLSDRLPVFLFTERQKELAGTDGQVTFRQVFEEEARMVVILYRSKWGWTNWTRVEENAIKDRRFNHATDFVFFVNMDADQPQKPEWLSSTHIRLKAVDHTPEEVAAIIAYRVRQLGGAVRQETVQDLAARLEREHLRAEEFATIYQSAEGVRLAQIEIEQLFAYVKEVVGQLQRSSTLRLGTMSEDGVRLGFSYGTIGMQVLWASYNRGSLRGSRLQLMIARANHTSAFRQWDVDRFHPIFDLEFRFHRDGSGLPGWKGPKEQSQFVLSSALADDLIKRFLIVVHKIRMDEALYMVNNDRR
jgi:hypothetical protein